MPDDRHCEERPDAAPGEVPRVAVEHLLRLHLDRADRFRVGYVDVREVGPVAVTALAKNTRWYPSWTPRLVSWKPRRG